jgi:hypothetical protein
MFTEISGIDITMPFVIDIGNGDYQLEISPIGGKLQVTNGVNGWGDNCKDEFKDVEVKILYEAAQPLQPSQTDKRLE